MKQSSVLRKQGVSERVILQWFKGVVFVAVLTTAFISLAEDVWFREGFAWDAPIMLAIHSLGSPWLDMTMRILTNLGQGIAVAVGLLAAGWFFHKHNSLDGTAMLVSLAGGSLLNELLKLLFSLPRPTVFPPLVSAIGFSFPSGHVVTSLAVYGFLAVILWRNRKRLFSILTFLLVPLVAFTRIYLGVHYPSDTLAAMAFTSLWVFIVFLVRDHQSRKSEGLQST